MTEEEIVDMTGWILDYGFRCCANLNWPSPRCAAKPSHFAYWKREYLSPKNQPKYYGLLCPNHVKDFSERLALVILIRKEKQQ